MFAISFCNLALILKFCALRNKFPFHNSEYYSPSFMNFKVVDLFPPLSVSSNVHRRVYSFFNISQNKVFFSQT